MTDIFLKLKNIQKKYIDASKNIQVLNGAGAAAVYGSQASNGALIVTTKKGKNGVTQVGFSHTTSIEEVAFFPKMQDQFGAGGSGYGVDLFGRGNFSYLENQSYGPPFDGTMRALGPPLADGSNDSSRYQFYPGHNDFWNKGIINQTDFNISNGDANSTQYFSAPSQRCRGPGVRCSDTKQP